MKVAAEGPAMPSERIRRQIDSLREQVDAVRKLVAGKPYAFSDQGGHTLKVFVRATNEA